MRLQNNGKSYQLSIIELIILYWPDAILITPRDTAKEGYVEFSGLECSRMLIVK